MTMPAVGYSFRCHLSKGSLAVPIRPILRYPHPGLKTVCAPVSSFDSALSELADDLLPQSAGCPGHKINIGHLIFPFYNAQVHV